MEVLVEADPTLQGKRRAVADVAHGLPRVAASADGRVARRDQGAGGNISDAVVAIGAREQQGTAAVLNEATPTSGVESAALEHIGQVEPATGVDRNAIVVPI